MSDTSNQPVMRIIGGPASGKEFVLDQSEYTIGRTNSAALVVPDIMISRKHVRIFNEGGKWQIQDLGSTNGTWIQGNRIAAAIALPMKTAVRIGDTLFEVFRPEDKTLDSSLISCRVAPITADSLCLDTKSPADSMIHDQKRLAALYKLQSLLASQSNESDLFNEILTIVSEVIAVDRAYLLLYVKEQDDLVPVAELDADGTVQVVSGAFISKSIVDYVKESNEGVLSADVGNDDRFHGESISGLNLNTIMCAPMHGRQQLCGLIYMVGTQASHRFGEGDLMLLTSIAHSAGMAIENSRLIDSNIKAERMAAVGMTAASLSHYVRNILGGIGGSISLLRMGIDSTDRDMMNEAWDILDKNQKRLSSLMLDLLNLAKEDSIDFGVYDFSDVITKAVELIRHSARESKIDISYDVSQFVDSPLFAEIDSRGIHRVILNLLRNGVDAIFERYGEDGGGKVKVEVEANSDTATVTVTDNGAGIQADQLAKVFEMFHTTKGDRGTGLGLAISKRIVETHRGTITVRSKVGQGTAFIMRIPTRHLDTSTSLIDISTLSRSAT
jgi:two-component system NtrC family sensor kinase